MNNDLIQQINSLHDETRPAFEIALSPLMKLALNGGGMELFEKLKILAQDALLEIINDQKRRDESLVPVPSPGNDKWVRAFPVDIRNGGLEGPVILKTITYWNPDSNRYRILIELPSEQWIDSKTPNQGLN